MFNGELSKRTKPLPPLDAMTSTVVVSRCRQPVDLPVELWQSVLYFLPVSAVLAFAQVCRYACGLVKKNIVWITLIKRDFGGDNLPIPVGRYLEVNSLYQSLWRQPESLLDFTLVCSDGGCYSPFYSARNIHVPNGRVYCSSRPRDVNLLSEPKSTGEHPRQGVIITKIVCQVPVNGFTSPLRHFACYFAHKRSSPSSEIPCPSELDAIFRENQTHINPSLRFCQMNGPSVKVFQLSQPQYSETVLTRLFEGALRNENIDVQFLGFIGKVLPPDSSAADFDPSATFADTTPLSSLTTDFFQSYLQMEFGGGLPVHLPSEFTAEDLEGSHPLASELPPPLTPTTAAVTTPQFEQFAVADDSDEDFADVEMFDEEEDEEEDFGGEEDNEADLFEILEDGEEEDDDDEEGPPPLLEEGDGAVPSDALEIALEGENEPEVELEEAIEPDQHQHEHEHEHEHEDQIDL